eukprot:4499863-Prymnesium_polylepis.1
MPPHVTDQKSKGVNETRTLEASFKQFDVDKSGEVSFKEFRCKLSHATPGHKRLYSRKSVSRGEVSSKEFCGGEVAAAQ